MLCPVCNKKMSVNTSTEGHKVYRSQKCLECGQHFKTIEVIIVDALPKHLQHKVYESMRE